MIPSAALNLLTFPQRWNGPAGELALNILVLPKADPLAGLAPPFADATLSFNAHLVPGLGQLPVSVPAGPALPIVQDAVEKRAFFDELLRVLNLVPNFRILPSTGVPGAQPGGVKKFLASSYREATRFASQRTSVTVLDAAYECVLREDAGAPLAGPPPPEFYWPEILGFVLRQPALAIKIGLLYRTVLNPGDPNPFAQGGYLYADFAADSDYAGGPRQLFAARVPPLRADQERVVFAPVLFPVDVGGNFDQVFPEAEMYDDGFARLVHGSQPQRAAQLETSHSTLAAVKDVGIRLAWDDEQVAIWLNRQLGINALDLGVDPPPAPLGVAGYRVDVFDDANNRWQSLLDVTSDQLVLGELPIGPFQAELAVEVLPANPNNRANGEFWLPSYFTAWAGYSLAVADPTPFALAGRLDSLGPRVYAPVGADQVALRYGNTYRFRVRLMDMTGGGPDSSREPLAPGPVPVANVPFRRFVPPKGVRVTAEPVPPIVGTAHFEVARPEIAYPDVVFTGKYADPVALLLAQAGAAKLDEREPTLPDPDVTHLRVEVQVRTLGGDPAATADTGQPFMPLYSAVRSFPPEFDGSLSLDFEFHDLGHVQPLVGAEFADGVPLPLPSARDVRLVFTALGFEDAQYWGTAESRVGAVIVERYVRAASLDERSMFVPTVGAPIQAIFLQPDPPPSHNLLAQMTVAGLRHESPSDLVSRLAHHLDLPVSELTFGSPAGQRLVYGCSSSLRHTANPDGSSITFSSRNELSRHWIVALRVAIDRDWTWDALAPVAFELQRQVGAGPATTVASVSIPRRVNRVALQESSDREHTHLVIFDAFDPKPPPNVPLAAPVLTYSLVPHCAAPETPLDPLATWTLTLPITTPPAQVPRIVSAGFAFSEYEHDERYSRTAERRRSLYLELDGPPLDPQDAYFARVLAYGPDPLLLEQSNELPSPAEPPLPIDPEPIRAVGENQPNDRAGLNAMLPLTASPFSDRHYLLPLPKDLAPDDPKLFGFFVYELRVGHDGSRPCTAQGRWGPPLRITGVQHPAPQLRCGVLRTDERIAVSAPYATPVFEERNIRGFPRTQLFALLYAQVQQADARAWRNVLLLRARAQVNLHQQANDFDMDPRLAHGIAEFSQLDVLRSLRMLGLPGDSPLSVLAVETLPEPGSPFEDPVGADLGQVRFLRTSTLTPVPEVCPPTD